MCKLPQVSNIIFEKCCSFCYSCCYFVAFATRFQIKQIITFSENTLQVFFTFFQKFFFARSFCAVWFARRFYFALCGLKKSPEDLIYLLNIIFFAKGISQTN